jgi:anti-sigma28 factor (negative regulator of flagellin synthesis)
MADNDKNERGQVIVLDNPASPLQQAAAALAETPEIDEEKVLAIREALAAGTYIVDPDAVAARLLAFEEGMPEAPGDASEPAADASPDAGPDTISDAGS